MEEFGLNDLKKLYLPPRGSHKGQNGKLMIIGGSHLFHAASLWALEVASRIVDLVHYSSVPENNKLVMRIKEEFRDGIVIPRSEIEAYIEEDDCILIGPGMTRDSETENLTNSLLKKYPHKQWVIDAGALQMMDISLIPKRAILTPHHGEFETLKTKTSETNLTQTYDCILLVKGEADLVCEGGTCRQVTGGNAGMTKGGTGDVLAGLVSALACKNDPFLAACAASYINKKAGEDLAKKVGIYFNASDLAGQVPQTMARLLNKP